MKIEPFNTYFPSLDMLDKKQKKSYFKIKKYIDRNKYIDVQGNISYLFLYIYGVMDQLPQDSNNKDIDLTIDRVLCIKKLYKNEEKISEYTKTWIGDLFLLKGNIEKALSYYELDSKKTQTHIANHIMNIKYEYKIPIKAPELLCTNKEITKFGVNHFEKIVEYCNLILQKEREDRGKDYLRYIGEKYKKERIYSLDLFCGYNRSKTLNFKTYCFYAIKELYNFATELSRDAENMLREDLNLPKVGEGWISETELYYSIKNYIGNKYKVINHYSPEWLGRQHLDVCIPSLDMAFEYQGKQHLEQIEYFGGEEFFKRQQVRDKRKKLKCDKNKMELHYVMDGYDLDEVKKLIDDAVNKKRYGDFT